MIPYAGAERPKTLRRPSKISRRKPILPAIPMQPSPAEIDAAKTPRGGFTRAQLEVWGVPWPPPKGWRKILINNYSGPESCGFESNSTR